jgi:hypothetical protein
MTPMELNDGVVSWRPFRVSVRRIQWIVAALSERGIHDTFVVPALGCLGRPD